MYFTVFEMAVTTYKCPKKNSLKLLEPSESVKASNGIALPKKNNAPNILLLFVTRLSLKFCFSCFLRSKCVHC
jgi:hypothetical protein